MNKAKIFIKRLLTPVSIMLIPHSSGRTYRLKIPSVAIALFAVTCVSVVAYLSAVAVSAFEYRKMQEKLDYYTGQFLDLRTTMTALKVAEKDFRRLFSLETKEDVLENLSMSDSGTLDMEILKQQIKQTIDTVGEIKDYLSQERDLYLSTPMGWPVDGRITSRFGKRIHPIRGGNDFHTGVDISTKPGTPVKATADGIVTFSGWSGANGNLVAIEHGFGYSTFYAHNKETTVNVGQVVRRGDVIAYVGSTGSSTGPHLHYEIWKEGKIVNPKPFITERKD
ncbi:MAG: M23 family metallopeptidase [Thermodesulfovibrionales bacterium]